MARRMTDDPARDGGNENWDSVEQGFRADGFLTPAMDDVVRYIRAQNEAWLSLARDYNRLAQRIYIESTELLREKSTLDPIPMGLQLVPRALSGFQGSVVVTERGMTIDAKILARGIYETAFWIGYLTTHPDQATQQLRRETLNGEIGLFKASLRTGAARAAGTEKEVEARLDEMQRLCASLPKAPVLERIAELGGFGPAYIHYKELSGSAAHVSLKSTLGYLGRDEDGGFTGHVIGPDFEGAAEAIYLAIYGLMTAIEALRRLTGHTAHDEEFRDLIDRFERLAHSLGEAPPAN